MKQAYHMDFMARQPRKEKTGNTGKKNATTPKTLLNHQVHQGHKERTVIFQAE
jgi:hypothetical protein